MDISVRRHSHYTLKACNTSLSTKKKVKCPRYRPTWPRGVQEVKASRFHDTRHTKVVRSSPLRTSRLYPPVISWYSFLEAELTPGTWTCRMLRKKSPVTRPGIASLCERTFLLSIKHMHHTIHTHFFLLEICCYLPQGREGRKEEKREEDSSRFRVQAVIVSI